MEEEFRLTLEKKFPSISSAEKNVKEKQLPRKNATRSLVLVSKSCWSKRYRYIVFCNELMIRNKYKLCWWIQPLQADFSILPVLSWLGCRYSQRWQRDQSRYMLELCQRKRNECCWDLLGFLSQMSPWLLQSYIRC